MSKRTGKISVKTQDIFPIIKKWLYSEHDIFIRELVANSTDAITKRASLGRLQNEDIPKGEITIQVDKEKKNIVVSDNGLGMTEEEVEKYITQLAFSGAEEFIEKMQKSQGQDIIGKFGLGLYSTFMVASKLEIETLSMQKDATPIKWTCEGDTEYFFSESDKKEVGTTITLHIDEEGEEYLDNYKITSILKKFCDFMPYQIKVLDKENPTVINETAPLWKMDPKDISDQEYKDFFGQLYPMAGEPLFWVHLKIDHPFTLEGILYFPKINPAKPFNESNIKLYCKQVFVSDNVKNIIPDFLSLLKGVIDSTDIPLNVSRSSLQGDPNIKKISNYVVKKVGDALKILFTKDRKRFEEIWEDIGLFTKYGCISDTKFDDLMRDQIIFKNSEDNYVTLSEYKSSIPENYAEKMKDLVIYFEKGVSDLSLKTQLLKEKIHSLETDGHIDPHFMQHVEMHQKGDHPLKFASVDSEFGKILGAEEVSPSDMKVKDMFSALVFDQKVEEEEDKTEVITESIKQSNSLAYYRVDEQMKRFSKMSEAMGGKGKIPVKKTFVINPANILIQNALKIYEKGNQEELAKKLCLHVKDMAIISSGGLTHEEKDSFIKREQDLLRELTSLAI